MQRKIVGSLVVLVFAAGLLAADGKPGAQGPWIPPTPQTKAAEEAARKAEQDKLAAAAVVKVKAAVAKAAFEKARTAHKDVFQAEKALAAGTQLCKERQVAAFKKEFRAAHVKAAALRAEAAATMAEAKVTLAKAQAARAEEMVQMAMAQAA
jgi:hypothetical protein